MNDVTSTEFSWHELSQGIVAYMMDSERWLTWLMIVVKIILIIIISRIVVRVSKKIIQHMMIDRRINRLRVDPRRTRTLGKLTMNIITYTINFIVILLILDILGFNLLPLLASAGIIGLAVAFGAQNLVRDIITGFFIVFEDQFAVGDMIQTGSFKGRVEEIGLRTTKIRSWTGEIHILPNGSISQVTNYSVHNALAVVDFVITQHISIDQATEIIRHTVKEVAETTEDIVREPEVLGVQAIAGTSVTLRIIAECLPNKDESVTRLLNERIKKALDESEQE